MTQSFMTIGCLSVPLFNQKKRSRLPLTSNPTENQFSSSHEYTSTQSPASSSSTGNAGYQNQAPRCPAPAAESSQWTRQVNPQSHQQSQYPSSRPAPGPVGRGYTCLPHPYKPGNTSSQMGQHNMTARPDSRVPVSPKQSSPAPPCSSAHTHQGQRAPASRYPPMGQSAYTQASAPVPPQSLQTRAPPPSRPSPGPTQQNNTWKFKTTSSAGPPRQSVEKKNPAVSQSQMTPASQVKPATENSLRILTVVIDGMRHWSQFKDRVPYLFEIFATLDSAVTMGSHGAKDFLMRDGKEVVPCVFYENEVELPRLIRGQVHRCVGNYDGRRNLLTCVSVRPALPSEQRNSQQAVNASDTEMRELVKSLSEV